ncbi:RES family NAD+ phosphorylase [Vallicoccus soli]|uniref:RES domain-containing protein n=1 Tax=Vallicoccus soli TaxID=2339232 RepID=A0A3A3YWJ7_9ACTN|nr:RES family NAD+ phosphorylase [Vallicoccus soli]RJK95927.1 RES domain-containing protein [Vallicoccus soli]
MTILFRHADPRFPFLWEGSAQPAARWHSHGSGPANYLADTADGAWAEFLRHEAITDPQDLQGIARRLWAVAVPDDVISSAAVPALPPAQLTGGADTYPACQAEAARHRHAGAQALRAPSAALLPGAARGQVVVGGLQEAQDREGEVLVLFGDGWAHLRGWAAVDAGAPTERVLALVRHL